MAFVDPTGMPEFGAYPALNPMGGFGAAMQPQAYTTPITDMQSYAIPGGNYTVYNYGNGNGYSYGYDGYTNTGFGANGYGYGGYAYPAAQSSMQSSDGGFSSMVKQFFVMLMFMLTSLGNPANGGVAPPTGTPNGLPGNGVDPTNPGAPGTPGVPGTPGDPANPGAPASNIAGDDASTNTGSLAILSAYADQIPHMNGKMTIDDLQKFVNSNPAVPPDVIKAAQNVIDNKTLYGLLCLKSDNSTDEGFDVSMLDNQDWGGLDLDQVVSIDSSEAWDDLKAVNDNLKSIDGNSDNGVSVDDLKKVALGEVHDPKLKDPTIQAAALAILNDPDLLNQFDGANGVLGDNIGQVSDVDSTKNSTALAVLAQYVQSKGITGTMNKDQLKQLADSTDSTVPDSVKQAAQLLYDHDDMYHLLCLETGDGSTNNDSTGFDVSKLSTDWGALNVDSLGTSTDPWNDLQAVESNLEAITPGDTGVTFADLRKVALGDPSITDPALQDPKIRAAALQLLYDDDLRNKFDTANNGTSGDGSGQVVGDPHFTGDDGETYDVMGDPGKCYNILSDKSIQFNAQFDAWGPPDDNGVQPTVISKVGIQANQHKIEMDRDAGAPTVDGTALQVNTPQDLGNGCTATWDGTTLTVTTPEYTITVNQSTDPNHPDYGNYLDQHITANHPYLDGVDPHGLWGQTVDTDHNQKDTGTDKGRQGGRVIDGTYTDYETGDLWGTSSNAAFNRFDPNANYNLGADGQGSFNGT